MRLAIVLVITAACGKGGDKEKPAAESSKGPERIPNEALAATPLQNVAAKASGVDFTIDLPVSALKPPEIKDAYASWEPKKAWFDTPSFSVVFSDMPMSPEFTGGDEPLGDDAKDRKIVRAEKLPDGGYLNLDARNDHAFFALSVCRPVPTGGLCCSVIQRSQKPIDGYDQMVAFAEKVCRWMKRKS